MTNAEDKVKSYELRDLEADDLFPMLNIISKIGIKEFKSCFQSEEVMKTIAGMGSEGEEGKKVDITAIGMTVALDIAGIILANVSACRDDLYQFLSQLSGLPKKEIAHLPMKTFIEMIMDVVKKEEFKDFFQAASKLSK